MVDEYIDFCVSKVFHIVQIPLWSMNTPMLHVTGHSRIPFRFPMVDESNDLIFNSLGTMVQIPLWSMNTIQLFVLPVGKLVWVLMVDEYKHQLMVTVK